MPNGFQNSIKSLISDGMKAASGLFSGGGGSASGSANAGFSFGGQRSLFGYHAGSAVNWDQVTGDLTQSPIALTCLNIICDNYCQARIRVERKSEENEDKYEPDPNHALLPILRRPNPFYSWDYLQRGLIASLHGQGDAYIGIERNDSGTPVELYWIPYGIRPEKLPGSRKLVDRWIYQQGNKQTTVPFEDVIHIAFGADPRRPGFGLSIASVLKQDQYSLQQGTNYTANVLRNNGTVGVILTPKEIKDENGNIVQATLDPKAVAESWKRKTQGDRAGEAMYIDYPLDITFPKNSPQDLAIDSILDRPEANICAVMRVSILLVGAHGGRSAKTYANYSEARASLWEECLLPLQQIIAAELTTQLLPQMGGDATTERVAYDTGGIRALQPDLDKLHERVRKDFESGLIDLYTAEVECKRVPDEAHKGVWHWMLPTITDSATSVDSLVPPGMRSEGTLPGSGTPPPLLPPGSSATAAAQVLQRS